MQKRRGIKVIFLWAILIGLITPIGFSQPIGQPITIINDTPKFDIAKVETITPNGPVLLARTSGADREPKVSVLNNGTTIVFWVNRNGSHHFNGVDRNGVQLYPMFETNVDIDVIVGINTLTNTNWTLNKADPNSGKFLIAATFLSNTLAGSDAVISDTVVDMNGLTGDTSQGHGFFKLYDSQLKLITPKPISISQFSAGHREWDCCWLNDGKFVIGTICQDHQYKEDPDWPDGGNKVATLNIFNSDGTRFKDEFFLDDLTGAPQDLRIGALKNGFVCVYVDNESTIGGSSLYKGIIFDNNGNKVKDFIATDEKTGIGVTWMDAGGGDRFVTIHELAGPDGIGLPASMVGARLVLGQLWNDQGERVGPYIVISQADDLTHTTGRPRVAMALNGTFAFSWTDAAADTVTEGISVLGRVFNADGTPATDAFITHPLPEFTTLGGTGKEDPGEPMCGMNNEFVAFSWGTRVAPQAQERDNALMVFKNPAKGSTSAVDDWSLYY